MLSQAKIMPEKSEKTEKYSEYIHSCVICPKICACTNGMFNRAPLKSLTI